MSELLKPYIVTFKEDGSIACVGLPEGDEKALLEKMVVWAVNTEQAIKEAIRIRDRTRYAAIKEKAYAAKKCKCGRDLDTWKHGKKSKLLMSCSICLAKAREALNKHKRVVAGELPKQTALVTREQNQRHKVALIKYEFLLEIVEHWQSSPSNSKFTAYLKSLATELQKELPPKVEMDDWGEKYLASLKEEARP